ncbi:inositol monophosphatase family protein [Bifidobacterium simiarum]|uniref:inositol monophosphatase family protein n=1 Tax=Bifidobacterium simiarum TaxID=2045441 RepID=UPI001BDC27E3|nr:inositol monophosphatase family protein [Bifidobacterium simiarum]MBT1166653.1 inositol monophosphatase [Bifidobacterium simiarum]
MGDFDSALSNDRHNDLRNGSHADPHRDPNNGPYSDSHNGSHSNSHNGPHAAPHVDPNGSSTLAALVASTAAARPAQPAVIPPAATTLAGLATATTTGLVTTTMAPLVSSAATMTGMPAAPTDPDDPLTSVNIADLVTIVRAAATRFVMGKAGGEARTHITVKGVADFVTEVDTNVQSFVKSRLADRYPDIQFLGEENGEQDVDFDGLYWVLDPIDGTTNLIHDYHHSAISLGLLRGGETLKAVLYQPWSEEMFTAEAGRGAFLNGKPIHVTDEADMSRALINVGTSPYHHELAERNFDIMRRVFVDSADIRRTGSAALDLAYVACGRADGYFEGSIKLWDYAAGRLLVTEAGGTVSNWQGDDLGHRMETAVLAGTPAIADLLRERYLND